MYFDSRRSSHRSLPWFDSRSQWEKDSDEYFATLEHIVEEIDDVESDTTFQTDLAPDDFDNGYQYAVHRTRELYNFLLNESDADNKEDLIQSLRDIYEKLVDLYDDAVLFDDEEGLDDDEDLDDEEDDVTDDFFDVDVDDYWGDDRF